MLSLFLACAAPPPTDSSPPNMPKIQALDLSCDRDAAQWNLELETLGWVNSATWWIGPPSLPVEAHSLRSIQASPSGDFERLTLELDQVSDPRLQENNSSTAALCPELDIAMRLSIFEVEQGNLAECWQWGGTLDWDALGLVENCEVRDVSW